MVIEISGPTIFYTPSTVGVIDLVPIGMDGWMSWYLAWWLCGRMCIWIGEWVCVVGG